ncbi:TPA: hypothetical protein NKR04_004537 [Vibrio parahaemolyticus]|uniref:hypothetical protein n=1 Tax=Vibrio parahaemolyticus TaxID=670 RepID=UPI000D52F66E|nr:hypothetical protein [Vibrio parahaemolyticus]AWG87314.1 hypothetical protein Vp2S01_p20003 [Vibrio parahaemolyticus]HCH1895958.1 hypothetical protein [Vibrio parahaemolyticus]
MMVKRKTFYSFLGVWLALMLAMLAVFGGPVMAAETAQPGGGGLLDVFVVLFGADKAALIMQIVVGVGFIWSVIIRPWISADKLAKLPGWLVALLEVFAGNYRKASNEAINSPSTFRKRV